MARVPPWVVLGLLLILLIVLALVSANLGALTLSFRTLWHTPVDDVIWQIWLNIRLPRVLLAIVVGIALAVSGALMQGLFRNPLADPTLLGISSGASLAVTLIIVLPFSLAPALALYGQMLAAFVGSLLVSVIIFSISRYAHSTLSRLLLAGIAINALCFALVGMLGYLSNDQQLRQLSLWSMGSLGQAQWNTLLAVSSLIVPACIWALLFAQRLNLLQLGDEKAYCLGVDVVNTRRQLLLLSALLVGAAVAVSGVIGFIGLVVPHLVRMRFSADHRWSLLGVALGGACLLLTADTLARTLIAPAEMPVRDADQLDRRPIFSMAGATPTGVAH